MRKILVLSIILFLLPIKPGIATEKIVTKTPLKTIEQTAEITSIPLTLVAAEGTVDTIISEVILRKAYRQIGLEIIIEKHPGERALRLANSGEVAGDVQRIDGLSAKYGNLIQIYPAINFIEGVAFSRNQTIAIDGWQSLKKHRIGLIRGIKFAENNTTDMDTYLARDYASLFRMLNKDRIDVAISPRLNGLYQIKKNDIDNVTPLSPAIAKFDLYHYLHKKHAALIPKLSAVFTEMATSGELIRIREHVIKVLMNLAEHNLPLCDDTYECFEINHGS
ncbi:substrate-binding periplasmic protein [Kiloniella antarctica]|uniref:Substrate-binding periplasmic protein n=1 Tax=Kiloniella antarctica TaxID=1550907 RepID=A0ABW5BHI7_9PROT